MGRYFLALGLILLSAVNGFGQTGSGRVYQLSLKEAIEFSKSRNKLVQAARIGETAAAEDRKDVRRAALPSINAGGSYQRFTPLTLFKDGLSHSTTGPRYPTPNSAALGVDVLFNIYSGGRQRALNQEQKVRLELATLNTEDQAGSVALKTATQYLGLVRLNDLQQLLLDQLGRARLRLNNINSLYRNQKVTRSDVLRAEVALSNVELALQQNDNDIVIANQQLDVLMDLPDSIWIIPADSAGMPKPDLPSLLISADTTGASAYAVRRAAKGIEVQEAKLKGIHSNYMPSLGFYAGYGISYPNYLFFPPVDQAYAIGFVGLKAQYSISSRYHNKHKETAAKLRIREAETQRGAYIDEIRTDIRSYSIKYVEALRRIAVNEHSVEEARENYRIVNTKYLHQLALLTDLLDADNLYHESRFNLIRAQTDALAIYYHILYSTGDL